MAKVKMSFFQNFFSRIFFFVEKLLFLEKPGKLKIKFVEKKDF
jgi:hypothetical protein